MVAKYSPKFHKKPNYSGRQAICIQTTVLDTSYVVYMTAKLFIDVYVLYSTCVREVYVKFTTTYKNMHGFPNDSTFL